MIDLEIFVKTTHNLEGDGLCILQVHECMEAIRILGLSLYTQARLPNLAAVLRARAKIEAGEEVNQYWSQADAPGQSGWYTAKILNKRPSHGQLCAVRYSNGEETWILKAEESNFRARIIADKLKGWFEPSC